MAALIKYLRSAFAPLFGHRFTGAAERPRMLALDGLRGLAVLLVLLDHASDTGMRLFPGADLNRAGKYGVYLFFVLSAFLLTRQLYTLPPADLVQARTWWHYAIRRFLRIFPLYAVVLCAYALMGKIPGVQIGTHLLLREGRDHFWTIPLEVKYYFLLPLLALGGFWALRQSWKVAIPAIAILGATIFGCFRWERWWSTSDDLWLWLYLPAFLLGSVAAVISCRMSQTPRADGKAWMLEVLGTIALAATLLRTPALYTWLFSAKPFIGKGHDVLFCGITWSVFLLCVLHGAGFWNRLLQWPPLRYLGLISFSMYLWHEKFLSDVDDMPVPGAVRVLIFLCLVTAIATASYLLVERPLAEQAKRWTKRPPQPLPPTPHSAAPAAAGLVSSTG